jgi:hypothetical protein
MTIRSLLEGEEESIEKRLAVLERSSIALAFDLQLNLFHQLLDEAENFSSGSPYEGGAVAYKGGLLPADDLKLRQHMFAGSFVQFTIAISHILRGQASEAYGHVRHAIENSGMAYLAKTEPRIVDYYKAGKEFEMAKEYPTSRIFPLSNDLTRTLYRMVKHCSRHLYGNLYSNSFSIIEQDSVDEGARVVSSVTFDWHDHMSFEELWGGSYFVLAAGYYALRLYEAAFDLPKGKWHTNLETFKESLDKSDLKVQAEYNNPAC